MTFAEVAVDAPTIDGRTYTYAVPGGISVSEGSAVLVPFGSRQAQGIIYRLTEESPGFETRDIFSNIEFTPIIAGRHLLLGKWISEYYMSPLFDALALMLPPGFRQKLLSFYSVSGYQKDMLGALSQSQDEIVKYLRREGPADINRVRRKFGHQVEDLIADLVQEGFVTRHWSWPRPRISHKYVGVLVLEVAENTARIYSDTLSPARFGKQIKLLSYLQGVQTLTLANANKIYGPSAVSTLIKRGLARVKRIKQERDPLSGMVFPEDKPLVLTDPQNHAVDSIVSSFDSGSDTHKSFLLKGVTGSGKTEVYMQAIADCIRRGKRCLFLVPEISLTPQMIERLSARFAGKLGVFHSGLTPGQQYDQWWKVKEGQYPIVLGSRNSIFLPQDELGLVVVDEEHEWTYKQSEASPRYHAREVAEKLCKYTGASLVLGSATPSLETYHLTQAGKHNSLELPTRVGRDDENKSIELPLADVELVDMREELKSGNNGILSRLLHERIDSALNEREQILLFINRRGSAPVILCRDCGTTLTCSRCDISLTYHLISDGLVCHSCGRKSSLPRKCIVCKSSRIKLLGLGTQRVVEEINKLFPNAKVIRWDRDALKEKNSYQQLMSQFIQGEADILVGTQMVAKGLHIPRVSLVGVILADVGIHLPDFRAGEKSFQLLCQVSGRAGRGMSSGKVVIQTYSSDHYAIQSAAIQDYDKFYSKEIDFRRQHNNPPFTRLVRLVYRNRNNDKCQREAERVERLLRRNRQISGSTHTDIIGPAPAFPSRVRGLYRWHIFVRGQDPSNLTAGIKLPKSWTVDVDPVSVL